MIRVCRRTPAGGTTAQMLGLVALLLALLAGCGEGTGPPAFPAPTPTPSAQEVQVEETADAVIIRSAIATLRVDKTTVDFHLETASGTRLAESAFSPSLYSDSV